MMDVRNSVDLEVLTEILLASHEELFDVDLEGYIVGARKQV